jgi:Flp pilus assembly protein TadD
MKLTTLSLWALVFLIAGCASVERQYRKATESRDEEKIRKFIHGHPESPLIMDAVAVLDTVRFENAVADSGPSSLERFLRAYPTSPLAPEASQILASRIRDQEMEQLRAQLIEEENPRTLVELADRHRDKGELETADSLYNRAIDTAPDLPGAHTGLGMVYLRMGRTEEADQQIDIARSLAPTNPGVLLASGEYYRTVGRPDLAINSFQTLLNQDPNDIHAHMNLGLLYLDVGQNRNAVWAFMRVQELDKDNVAVLYYFGVAYADQGDANSAVRYLEQYLRAPHTEEDAENLESAQALLEDLRSDVRYGQGRAGSVVADPKNPKPRPKPQNKPQGAGNRPQVGGGWLNPWRGGVGGGVRRR